MRSIPLSPRDLLLAEDLTPEAAGALLEPYGFRDLAAADANLQALASDPQARRLAASLVEVLFDSLAQSADPDSALNLLERFTRAAVNRIELLAYLREAPRTVDLLARTFGASPFMAEILIRDPGQLYWIADPQVLDAPRDALAMGRDLDDLLAPLKTDEARLDLLRYFRRKETLHIGVRDVLRLATVEGTLACLSALAEVVIERAYAVAFRSTARQLAPGLGDLAPDNAGFAVIAMGKLGGGELNFSSDVDLIYVYDPEPLGRVLRNTSGLSTAELFDATARRLTAALADSTNEGLAYRVDLRLRPEGRAGSLAVPLEGCRAYYAQRAATWERLALIKAWPVAGDRQVGRRFLDLVSGFIFDASLDARAAEELRAMKRGIDGKVAGSGQSLTHVKLGTGGIREVELIAQLLQVAFGARRPALRQRGTLAALTALANDNLLTQDEHARLRDAYLFLRDVENKLQMANDIQVHALPTAPADLAVLAARLGYPRLHVAGFLEDYRRHTQSVNELFLDFFDARDQRRILAPQTT